MSGTKLPPRCLLLFHEVELESVLAGKSIRKIPDYRDLEDDFRIFLTELMKSSPNKPLTKDECYQMFNQDRKGRSILLVKEYLRDKIWAEIAQEQKANAWSKGGRRPDK